MLKTFGVLLATAALGVSSADVAAHKARMDDAQDASFDLKDGLDAKDATKTADAAKKLGGLLDAEDSYWAATGLDDVRRLAEANRGDAAAVAERAGAGDWAGAEAAYARLQAGCRSCHDQHPERRVTPKP
jgi:hypothetical protein